MPDEDISLVQSAPDDGENVSIVDAVEQEAGAGAAGAVVKSQDSAASGAAGNAAESKGEAEKTEPTAPETYELKLPDGFVADEAAMGELTPMLKELKCSQETAQKLLDLHFKQLESLNAAQEKARDEAISGWLKDLKTDSEIGGPDLKRNLSYGAKVLNEYATQELKDILVETGLDKHPAMAKMLVKVGRALSEDRWADGGRQGSTPRTANDVANLLFDKTL